MSATASPTTSLHRSTPPPPPYPSPTTKTSSLPLSPSFDPSRPLTSPAASSSRLPPRRPASPIHAMQHPSIPPPPSPPTFLSPPASPSPSSSEPRRTWRPTSNVPLTLSQRHRARQFSPVRGDDEDRNRWLAEDEGLDGVARSIGTTRRRRRRFSLTNHGDGGSEDGGGDDNSPDPPDPPDLGGSGPSTLTTTSGSTDPALGMARNADHKTFHRPISRSARSVEHSSNPPARPTPSQIGAVDINFGAHPPRIADIIPVPSSPAREVRPMHGSTQTREGATGITSMNRDTVPDYASGRGGDGVSGVNMPVAGSSVDIEETDRRRDEQLEMLNKLRRILGWLVLFKSIHSLVHP